MSAIVGAALWEVGKQVVGQVIKSSSERSGNLKKSACGGCDRIRTGVDDVVRKAEKYLCSAELPSGQRQDLSRDIKSDLKRVAADFGEVNATIATVKIQPLPTFYWVNFRRAATWDLDSAQFVTKSYDSDEIRTLHRTADNLKSAVAALKRELA